MEYSSISTAFIKDFFGLVDKESKIFITCHYSPDDDAVSSALSLYYVLTSTYPQKDVNVIITGKPVDRFSVFQNFQKIKFVADITEVIKNDSLVIFLDGSQFTRFSNFSEKFSLLSFRSICIDHHINDREAFTLCLQESTSSSTSELIYLLCTEFQNNSEFCNLILFGILGDTGTFNYIKPDQTRVFDIVKNILHVSQLDIQDYKSKYSYIEPQIFEIIKEFIKNTKYKHIQGWPDFTISYVTRSYIQKHRLTDTQVGQASDIYTAQYLRVLKGYPWGIAIKPYSDGSCRFSLRSLPGSVNVRLLMQQMGLGGGHNRAAGGSMGGKDLQVEPNQAFRIISSWLKKNSPVLT
ncbi:MAG TPA: DHH family phosphoesterase [Patescibacteria group bacterium]